MSRDKNSKKSKSSINNIMYRTVGTLFVLTMLSLWLLSGLFAKYVVTGNAKGSARVANDGILKFELLEHEANETYEHSGIYELDSSKEVNENTYGEEINGKTYGKVIPGVDIPKDPFIRLKLDKNEVSYELFVKVTKSDPFPEDDVTYKLTDNWKWVKTEDGVDTYQYVTNEGKPYIFLAGTPFDDTIYILENNKLEVSEHYVAKDGEFSLTFSAYMKQSK